MLLITLMYIFAFIFQGELLKKLHNKIIKGEMVADTMPDVIKHTQEKPKVRPNKIHAQRRKSSTDDPRYGIEIDVITYSIGKIKIVRETLNKN